MIELVRTSKADPRVREMMAEHYSQPKGFVGRQLIYLICHEGAVYGAIAAGSATRHLPGRAAVLGTPPLNALVNNTFFHVKPLAGYPLRNFTTRCVAAWRQRVQLDWIVYYGDIVAGFETLVELPRTGELYRRDGWVEVGQTKGFTCKREGGKGTDSWSGRRVWNTTELRPKRVFVRKAEYA